MHKKLLRLLNHNTTLTVSEVDLCKKCFEPVIFPKNRIIEEENKIPKYLYFVVSGYVRLF